MGIHRMKSKVVKFDGYMMRGDDGVLDLIWSAGIDLF